VRAVERKMPDGHTVGFRINITDLVKATDAAQAAARLKGQFLANMSHEIRTPMNAILGMLQLLQNTDLNGQQLDYTTKAQSAAKALLGLINDVLDFSKVEAGKMVLDTHAFRLDRLLRDVSVILASSVADKPIDVLFDIDKALPEVVLGDATRLRQVLINLGSNAVKFTPAGQVVVALRLLSRSRDVAEIEFSVQDTGIGISPENQGHIFDGFSQAEASTTRKFGGTGLGLPISQRLVQLMGGTLALSSQPGFGTRFSFVLALTAVIDIPAELIETPRDVGNMRRVLVVDDNPRAAELMQQMVQSWGWQCDSSTDGLQAQSQIALQCAEGNFPYAVIYLDCQMAPTDGWETARAIRQCCATHNGMQPAIIMISSLGREAMAHRTQREQELVNGFLVRPVTASMLLDAVIDPLHAKAQSRHTEKRSTGVRRLDSLRLLVVEDNLINQQVAEELLAAEGALVALAANGRLGVEAVAAAGTPFDAVLMDIQMPVMDGYAATREIREVLGLKTLPIIAMTANALESDRQDCLAAGMNEHVGKPFDVAQLVAVIRRLTGR
jgi:CheY-like chemotaxis protein/two-component sensor histidine kinase